MNGSQLFVDNNVPVKYPIDSKTSLIFTLLVGFHCYNYGEKYGEKLILQCCQ